MKKVSILLVAILALFVANVNAQSIGMKIGGNASKFVIKDDLFAEYQKQNMGLQIGTFIGIPIVPFFDLQPEIMVYQKGNTYKQEILGVKTVSGIDLFYLDVPINLRVTLPMIPIYALAGPYFGYAFQGNSFSKAGDLELSDEITFSKDGFRNFDFGINAGVGYMKNFGPIHFFGELRYNMGMYNLDGTDLNNYKNSNLSLSVGLMLGKK